MISLLGGIALIVVTAIFVVIVVLSWCAAIRERTPSMSLRSLEAAILRELRKVAGNNKLRLKDIQEWSSGNVVAREGETLYCLPENTVNVAVRVVKP